MSNSKKLATILEKRKELAAIQQEIVAEMIQEVGAMTVVLFKASPSHPLWRRMPELESRLAELAKISKVRKFKVSVSPPTAAERSVTDLPNMGCTPGEHRFEKEERPSFQAKGFVPDIPDGEL